MPSCIGDWKSVLAKRYGLECFSSHLTGRSQQVSVNNVMAMYVSLVYVVPQRFSAGLRDVSAVYL